MGAIKTSAQLIEEGEVRGEAVVRLADGDAWVNPHPARIAAELQRAYESTLHVPPETGFYRILEIIQPLLAEARAKRLSREDWIDKLEEACVEAASHWPAMFKGELMRRCFVQLLCGHSQFAVDELCLAIDKADVL